MPKVMAVVSQKGGCGKTTTAINALYWFTHFKKLNVILVDADKQRSSARTAKEIGIPYEEIIDATELSKRIPVLSKDYDLVIIDGPASTSEINRSILTVVDLALIPSRVSVYDVEGAEDTIDYLLSAQRICRNPPMGVVFLNNVTSNSIGLREAIQYFENRQDGVQLLKESIPYRVCIEDIGSQGQSIFQMRSRSAKEVAAKYDRLFSQMLEIYSQSKE
jgi:chromosome partitioning protein